MVRHCVFLLLLRLPLTAQNDTAVLLIRIVEGEGAVYPIGSRATRGVTVQVTDETGKPVDNAAVSFRLPDDGPTGAFSSGMRTEIVTTGVDGRANVWGMQWNRLPGPLEVRITAAKGKARAGTVCGLYLSNTLAAAEPKNGAPSRWRSHRRIWIGVGIAAAAFVGVAVVSSRGTPSATAGVNAPQIGTPTIIIGRP
ncbi:MAG: hypothetical protein JWO19_3451 [Bryobacterales bacterium]|nr:hypothetical protein [Bryobacterales bacterium]